MGDYLYQYYTYSVSYNTVLQVVLPSVSDLFDFFLLNESKAYFPIDIVS